MGSTNDDHYTTSAVTRFRTEFPTGGVCSPSGQMDKASVSGAEDWGFESPLGCRSVGALAQSEECVLCKHEVRGSKPRCSRYFLFFCASAKFCFRKCSISEGYRLGWPSGPRRSTQVRVSSEAWVRIPLQAISRGIGLVV